jgi:phospholipase C
VLPTNGTIFERLDAAGISWTDYYNAFPLGADARAGPAVRHCHALRNAKPFAQFYADARAGTLPSFSMLDPEYGTQSQEDAQNVAVGEGLLAQVVHALGASPAWRKTLFILVYDEHGGYYDHVPPPVALAPDAIPPLVQPGQSTYDGFARYGFRVPSVVVGPYAKRDYVSHVVHDHTSILAFLERKWTLPAMTYRDANANDLDGGRARPRRAVSRDAARPLTLSVGERRVVLRVHGRAPAAGRYVVVVRHGRRALAERTVHVG